MRACLAGGGWPGAAAARARVSARPQAQGCPFTATQAGCRAASSEVAVAAGPDGVAPGARSMGHRPLVVLGHTPVSWNATWSTLLMPCRPVHSAQAKTTDCCVAAPAQAATCWHDQSEPQQRRRAEAVGLAYCMYVAPQGTAPGTRLQQLPRQLPWPTPSQLQPAGDQILHGGGGLLRHALHVKLLTGSARFQTCNTCDQMCQPNARDW